ncbi:MAG: flagellar hook-length control protein FliK [Shimia sp.]|uniref:flagellar hook-length control protein FliK n=1 Tax=Shimia sp. TaxID=1954381 RepID=UPI00405A37CB
MESAPAKPTQKDTTRDAKVGTTGFSDVYDQAKRDDAKQASERVQENGQSTEVDGEETLPTETDGDTPETDTESEGDAAQSTADILGLIPAQTQESTPRTATQEASDFGKTIRALEGGTTPQAAAEARKATNASAMLNAQAMQTTSVDNAKAAANAEAVAQAVQARRPALAGSADPKVDATSVQVSVRSTATSGNAASQAGLIQRAQMTSDAQAEQIAPTDVDVSDGAEVELTRTGITTSAATNITTRAQMMIEPPALQTATQMTANTVPTDVDASLSADATAGAREDVQLRQSTSGLDVTQQSRLTQTQHTPAQVVQQVADAVRASDKGIIELTMDPPELGRLRVAMSEAAGVMNITISAENSATSDLMRKHIELLRKDFMNMGYDDVSFTFEQGDTSGQQNSDHPDQAGKSGSTSAGTATHAETTAVDPATPTSAPQSPPADGSSGLDIRL